MQFKIITQNLWKAKTGWDDELPEQVLKNWKDLAKASEEISEIQIPRYVNQSLDDGPFIYELFCFTDASKEAYAAAIYLKVSNVGTGKNLVTLNFCKSHLAPVKELTIPRLELVGVLIGVRALDFVSQQLRLEISKFVLWTDSQCVIDWLTTAKPQPVFVERRLKEIRSLMIKLKISIRYIPSAQNPVDLASRGIHISELTKNSLWWNGPEFLSDPSTD